MRPGTLVEIYVLGIPLLRWQRRARPRQAGGEYARFCEHVERQRSCFIGPAFGLLGSADQRDMQNVAGEYNAMLGQQMLGQSSLSQQQMGALATLAMNTYRPPT